MRRGQIALVGSLALVILVVWAIVARLMLPALSGAADAAPSTSASSGASPAVTAAPSASALAAATPTPALAEPSPSPTIATDAPTPTQTDDPTGEPDSPTDPRLAYAEFLLRLAAARADVQDLNAALVVAAENGDTTTVRATAVDILQFADRERDWLLTHPPAACYADAHDAAGAMLEAYATVAERAIDWADADTGLETLDALAEVLTAAGEARVALDDLAQELEAATCPA
jgi:hypothetical protein